MEVAAIDTGRLRFFGGRSGATFGHSHASQRDPARRSEGVAVLRAFAALRATT